MLIAIKEVNRNKIILKRGTGYNLYFNKGTLRTVLDEDMIKETDGGVVRVLEEIWRVPTGNRAYNSYLKNLKKGKLSNGEMDKDTKRIHIEKAIDFEASEFSCQRK